MKLKITDRSILQKTVLLSQSTLVCKEVLTKNSKTPIFPLFNKIPKTPTLFTQ